MFGKKKKEVKDIKDIKDMKNMKDRLREFIRLGLDHMQKSAETFNEIVIDEEMDQYSKQKAAAIVVMLDSCLRLSLIEQIQPAVVASGILMKYADEVEVLVKSQEQLEEQDQLAKEGKNIINDIPKTVH